jgi:tetratricopeptide (TPR) repeat protein
LGRLEAAIGKLGHPDQRQPTEILTLLDTADELLRDLSAAGADLGPERGRFETIANQIRGKSKPLLKQLGGPPVLQTLRSQRVPSADAWWWFLDELTAARRKAARARTFQSLAIGAVVLAALSGLYMLFLVPDKASRLRYRHETAAERAIAEGDLPKALSEVNLALDQAPRDGGLLVLKGVILELTGNTQAAESVFNEARSAYAGAVEFLVARAEAYLRAGTPERALQDTLRMVEMDPSSPIGYYLMGSASAALGNLNDAHESFSEAARLAGAAGQTEVEGMARVQLANLALLLTAPQPATPTPP